ncbi:hypothetical protein HPB47_013886 [Ixodes persulcatus]|uniref:Uncharacterized protein n=1 Tax=Ixodes persulcatus TaxID=34615 RepID=A0AC60QXK8_IXOPE|nr:hypothetical protein HPB47_013886 [Ixodes persulcatus]
MHGGSGLFNVDLLLCYLTVWTLVFLACTHMRFYIRVLRLVAPSTVVVLLMLLMGALRLPGAWSGIRHMVSFDTARLWETALWHGATSGVLTSLGVATGSIFVFASFNQITTPVIRVVQGVVWLDLLTSLVSCFLLFSVLGNLAHSTREPVGDIFTGDGTSMMYVLCSELIGQLHFPQLWASLLSLVLFQLGLNQAQVLNSGPSISVRSLYKKSHTVFCLDPGGGTALGTDTADEVSAATVSKLGSPRKIPQQRLAMSRQERD